MDIECFYLVRTGTWGKAMRKMETRALTVQQIQASPGRRAAIWNAYLASLVPYPAHVATPDRTLETLMTSHFRVAVGLGGVAWAPHFILSGLGLLFQVPGAPRCPVAHARAIWGSSALSGRRVGAPSCGSIGTSKVQSPDGLGSRLSPRRPPPEGG